MAELIEITLAPRTQVESAEPRHISFDHRQPIDIILMHNPLAAADVERLRSMRGAAVRVSLTVTPLDQGGKRAA